MIGRIIPQRVVGVHVYFLGYQCTFVTAENDE